MPDGRRARSSKERGINDWNIFVNCPKAKSFVISQKRIPIRQRPYWEDTSAS